MRICPFTGCGEELPDHLFSCKKHWFQLNQNDRQTINAAFADYQAGNIGIEKLREVQQEVLGIRGKA